MLESIIVVFVVGLLVYYMIRHPVTTVRRILQALGIFTLGIIGIATLILLVVAFVAS